VGERVLATPAAVRAVETMRSLLSSGLSQRVREVMVGVRSLANPALWDGPDAVTYRQVQAPRYEMNVARALQTLQRVEQHVDQVIHDIMRAGSAGSVGGVVLGKGLGDSAGLAGKATQPPQYVVDGKVRDALANFRQHIDDAPIGGNQRTLEQIDGMLAGMTPDERAAFLSQLTPAELRDWNARISQQSYGGRGFLIANGLTQDDKIQLANLLFGSADPSQLATLEQNMPALQPNDSTKYLSKDHWGNATWQSTSNLPLYGPSGQPDVMNDINQGDDGDCWFLSGLGAVAQANPALIQQNIHQNANGTYTVTFYRNGQPVQVTITDDMPYSGNRSDYPYAKPGSGDDAKWVMIYEKAYSQFKGGYASIDGGFGDQSMADITGQPSTRQNFNPLGIGNPSLGDLKNKLDGGYAITAGSTSPAHWPWDDPAEFSDGGKVVNSHEYMVQSVDTGSNPPTITLRNPWGHGGGAPEFVTLSQSDFYKYFGEVSLTKVK
jgi:Calpain family cysteine protease